MPFPIKVQDVMSRPVQSVTVDTTAAEAARQCYENDIGSLVVLEDGDVVGIVTGTDLLEVLGTASEPGTHTLDSVMTAPVVTTAPDTPVRDAVATMQENQVARLVVLEEGDLVGIVSTDDVIRYVPQIFHRQELEYEASEREPGHVVRPETTYEDPDWEFECVRSSDDSLGIGDRVEFTKTITEQDVRTFAAASGDTNKLHLDSAYAKETRFGRRIVHGTLVSGLISAALARLPGLTIYLSQDLSFHAPVDIGTRATAVCEIVGTIGEDKYELTTDVFSDGELVIEGEAAVIIDDHAETARIESAAMA